MQFVRDCMFQNVATFSPSTTLMDAMRSIVRQGPGFAVILDAMRLTGLVTEYDFIRWIVAEHNPEKTVLNNFQFPRPKVVREGTNCQELLEIYNQRHFRRFPVLNEEGLLSGGIMEKQILQSVPRSNLMAHYRVADAMLSPPPAIRPEISYREVAERMLDWHHGCVLVVDAENEHLLGIITEGDLLRHRVRDRWHAEMAAREMMTRTTATIRPEKDLLFALNLFLETEHRRLPVVEESGRLVGLLTQTDLLKRMTQSVRSHQAILNPEDVSEPAVWFEPDGEHRILAFNLRGAEALGLNPETWVGRSVADLASDREIWPALAVLLQTAGRIGQINLPIRTGEGNALCVTSRFSLIHTPAGEDRIFWTIEKMDVDALNPETHICS